MKNWLLKTIAILIVAFITSGWILLDIEYNPDQAEEFTYVEENSIVVVNNDLPVFDTVVEGIQVEEIELDKKQGSLTESPSSEIIEHFLYVEPEEEEVEEEIYYEPSIEELLEEELEILPDGMMNYLYDNGWEIELTDIDLAEEFDFPMIIAGLTEYDTRTIYISNIDNYYIRRVTLHEVGHAVAYQANDADLTKEFLQIYEEERYNFVDCTSIGDGHEFSDSQEYFASVFQNIYLNYDETYASVPKTVEYIEIVIDDVMNGFYDTKIDNSVKTKTKICPNIIIFR